MKQTGRTTRIAADAAERLSRENTVIAYDHPDYEHTPEDAIALAKQIRDIYYQVYDPDRDYLISFSDPVKMQLTLVRSICLIHIHRTHHSIAPTLLTTNPMQ